MIIQTETIEKNCCFFRMGQNQLCSPDAGFPTSNLKSICNNAKLIFHDKT